jgi:copper(I)-binding protein
MKNVRFARDLALGFMLLVLLAACAPAAAPAISIEGAWGRPSMSMPTAGSMYMVIKNSGDAPDTLLSGSSPACGSIEVHEMVMKSDGTMGMNLIENPLEIPAGGEVTLEVGGLHIMCIMKKDTFIPDNTVDLTLVFEKSGEMPLSVELRSE